MLNPEYLLTFVYRLQKDYVQKTTAWLKLYRQNAKADTGLLVGVIKFFRQIAINVHDYAFENPANLTWDDLWAADNFIREQIATLIPQQIESSHREVMFAMDEELSEIEALARLMKYDFIRVTIAAIDHIHDSLSNTPLFQVVPAGLRNFLVTKTEDNYLARVAGMIAAGRKSNASQLASLIYWVHNQIYVAANIETICQEKVNFALTLKVELPVTPEPSRRSAIAEDKGDAGEDTDKTANEPTPNFASPKSVSRSLLGRTPLSSAKNKAKGFAIRHHIMRDPERVNEGTPLVSPVKLDRQSSFGEEGIDQVRKKSKCPLKRIYQLFKEHKHSNGQVLIGQDSDLDPGPGTTLS